MEDPSPQNQIASQLSSRIKRNPHHSETTKNQREKGSL